MLLSSEHRETVDLANPLLHYPFVVDATATIGQLFLASRADETFEAEGMELIKRQKDTTAFIFEAADHSLLIPGDIIGSLKILDQVVHAYSDFLESLIR
jgi:hypothetical protein